MKILVAGGSGLLGRKFVSLLEREHEIVGTYHSEFYHGLISLDLNNEAQIYEVLSQEKPELVIHTAAMTDVAQCEEQKFEAFRINTLGTINLAKLCRDFRSKLVYFSTDYVFSGNHSPYVETDGHHPINFYGLSKLEAERIIGAMFPEAIIIRPSILYGYNDSRDKPTFVIDVLKKLKQNQKVIVDNRRIKYPLLIDDVVINTMKVVESGLGGIFHFCSSEPVTRYEWALKIADIFGYPPHLIEGVNTEGSKPLNIELLNTHSIDLAFRKCDQGLDFIKEELNENSES